MVQYVAENLLKVNYYTTNLNEMFDHIDTIKTEANLSILQLKKIYKELSE